MSYSLFWFLQLRFYHLPVYFSHSSFWFLFFTPAGFDSNLSHAKWHLTLETEIDPTKHVSFNLLLIIPMQMAQNKYTIKIKWTRGQIPILKPILLFFFAGNIFLFLEANYFTILYWFCHTLTWIHLGCTCVPHLTSHPIPPHPIPLGHPSAPAPRTLYHASNMDWWSVHIW